MSSLVQKCSPEEELMKINYDQQTSSATCVTKISELGLKLNFTVLTTWLSDHKIMPNVLALKDSETLLPR